MPTKQKSKILRVVSIIVTCLFLQEQVSWSYPAYTSALRPYAAAQSAKQIERVAADLGQGSPPRHTKASPTGSRKEAREPESEADSLKEIKKMIDEMIEQFVERRKKYRKRQINIDDHGLHMIPVVDAYGDTLKKLIKEDRFDDINEIMGYFSKRVYEEEKRTKLTLPVLEPFYYLISQNLLAEARIENLEKRKSILLEKAENLARVGIEIAKKQRITLPIKSYDVLIGIYAIQNRYEDIIELAEKAILVGLTNSDWCLQWTIALIKAQADYDIKYNLTEDIEKSRFLYEVFYKLSRTTGDKSPEFILLLSNIYLSHFFYKPEIVQRTKKMIEEGLSQLEEMAELDAKERARLKAQLQIRLAFAYRALNTIDGYKKVILLNKKYLKQSPEDGAALDVDVNAKKYLAYLVMKENRAKGLNLFDAIIKQGLFDKAKRPYREYLYASVEYLKGNFAKAKKMYESLLENIGEERFIGPVLYDYTDILLNLGEHQAAREALIRFFKEMDKVKRKTAPEIKPFLSDLFYQNREELKRILELIMKEVSTPQTWRDTEPAIFQSMLEFLLTYSDIDGDKICWNFLDYLAKEQPGVDFWPQIKAVIVALLYKDPHAARNFIRHALYICKDEPLKRELEKYLREETVKNCYSIDDYLFFSALHTIANSPQNKEFIDKECYNSLDAVFTRTGDEPKALFEALEDARKKISAQYGAPIMDTGIYIKALTLLLSCRDKFYSDSKQVRIFDERLKNTLAGLTSQYKETFNLLEGTKDLNSFSFYNMLAFIMQRLKEHARAIDFYKKILRFYDGPDKLLEKTCVALNLFLHYGASLEYTGKHKESQEMIARWVNGVNDLMDKAESGMQLPEGISKEELYKAALSSIWDLDIEILIRAAMVNEDLRTAVTRVLDAWLVKTEDEDDIFHFITCAHLAYTFLNDMERFEKFMIKVNTLTVNKDLGYRQETFWGVYTNYILGYIYSAKGKNDASKEAHAFADEMLEKMFMRGHIEPLESLIIRAIGSIFKRDYKNAVMTLEEGADEVKRGGREEKLHFLYDIFLGLSHSLNGETEKAFKVLEKAVRSEAQKWRESKNSKRQELIWRSRFSYPGYVRMLPEEFRRPCVKLLSAQLVKEGLGEEESDIIFNMLEVVDCEEAVSLIMSHFGDILSGTENFIPARDIRLIRWLTTVPTRKKLIIGSLCEELSASANVPQASQNGIRKNGLAKGKPPSQPADYPIAVDHLYNKGQYAHALHLIKKALELPATKDRSEVISKLEQLQEKCKRAMDILTRIKTDYEQDNFEEAASDCNELLGLNPKDTFAQNVKENIEGIMQARGCLQEGNLDEAIKALESVPHQDKKVRGIISQLNRVCSIIKDVASLLDESMYIQAETHLSKVVSSKIMGVDITEEADFLKGLYDRIGECKSIVAQYEKNLRESDSINGLYENAQLLLQYPEHKEDVFKLICSKAVAVFNEKNYKQAFNIARLIYELKDYKPDGKYLKKAQSIISHTASNIWLPKLVDDYFIIKAMSEAERFRDERDRVRIGLKANAPLEFKFRYFDITETGFELSGLVGVNDMRDFAQRGDTFTIKPEGHEQELQPLFRLSYAAKDKLVFTISNRHEDYSYIMSLLETTLTKGGTVTRIPNLGWINQKNMLAHVTKSLKGTSAQTLRADANEVSFATTDNKNLDHALGILLDIPNNEKESKPEREVLVTQKEKEESLVLDKEEKDGIVDGLNTDIPFTIYQGPGGTGKTFVITWIIELLTPKGSRVKIRVLSQTNPGVDNIGRNLKQRGKFFARVGNDEEVISAEVYEIWKQKAQKLKSIKDGDVPNVLLGTINGLANDHDIQMHPAFLDADYVIVDEASRATVPESLWALFMFRGIKKFILVGDHYQLPAHGVMEEDIDFARDEFGRKNIGQVKIDGFGNKSLKEIFDPPKIEAFRISLLEKVLELFEDESGIYQLTKPNFHFFKVNRRSGKLIVELDNYFYGGRLIAGRKVDGIVIEDNYKGRYQDDKVGQKKEDTINKGEIAKSIIWAQRILKKTNLRPEDIAIITPYAKQEEIIREALLAMANIFELSEDMKQKDITDEKIGLIRSNIQEQQEIINILVQELHPDQLPNRLNELLQILKQQKTPSALQNLREYLGFGDRFIPSKEIMKRFFSISTVDSAIGSEWRAVIISWVRANYNKNGNRYGKVGFLADKIDGWRRRNVGIGRPEDILINIWDQDTFAHATDPEIRKWAQHNIRVFKESHQLGCDRLDIYRDMFKENDSAEPVDIGIDQNVLAALATQA